MNLTDIISGPTLLMPYGIHAGETIEHIFDTHLKYCSAFVRCRPKTQEAQLVYDSIVMISNQRFSRWNVNKTHVENKNLVLPSGKHKGKKLTEVFEKNYSYILFLANNPPLKSEYYESHSELLFNINILLANKEYNRKIKSSENNDKTNELIELLNSGETIKDIADRFKTSITKVEDSIEKLLENGDIDIVDVVEEDLVDYLTNIISNSVSRDIKSIKAKCDRTVSSRDIKFVLAIL